MRVNTLARGLAFGAQGESVAADDPSRTPKEDAITAYD